MTTIAEVREKYPQYKDLSDEQLARGLHDKFYSDMPYEQFAEKVGLTPSRAVPDSAPQPTPADTRTTTQKIDAGAQGVAEALISLLSNATTGVVGRVGGTIGGIAGAVASGKYGTQEGAADVSHVAQDAASRMTYVPSTPEGREILSSIGKVFDESKLAGLGPSAPVVSAAPSVTTQNARRAGDIARQQARDVRARFASEEPALSGVGAAAASDEVLRRQRASDLPVPIELTKGQATRDFSQQQFEREAAKNADYGGPLRQRISEQNEKILQNFDTWIDQTGAEGGGLRAVGKTVTDALVAKSNKAKAEIRAAYKAADESGAMQEPVDVTPLRRYLDDHKAEAINAPVLTSAEAKLGYVEKDGAITIKDLEEVRKMVGRLGAKDATNSLFARELKGVIDEMTDGAGGELYSRARALRAKYGKEFDDHAVIERLLSFKPGTKDRSVAYEDVFAHSILNGSLDDVHTIRNTLQTAGPEGRQAWRELQGSTLQHLRDEITSSVQIDQAGNRVVSPAKLDRMVRELDKDGKLDFIFGKQGGQQIRDINGIAQDVLTSPPGSVNHSNTASILTQAIDTLAGKVTGIPFAGSVVGYASKEIRNAKGRRMVKKSLEDQ